MWPTTGNISSPAACSLNCYGDCSVHVSHATERQFLFSLSHFCVVSPPVFGKVGIFLDFYSSVSEVEPFTQFCLFLLSFQVPPPLPIIYVFVRKLMHCFVTPHNSPPDTCSCWSEDSPREGAAAQKFTTDFHGACLYETISSLYSCREWAGPDCRAVGVTSCKVTGFKPRQK